MTESNAPDCSQIREKICELRELREQQKSAQRRPRRKRLNKAERAQILNKTGARCHICGGDIVGVWDADHVVAHSAGGEHSVDNFLPAHSKCNNYRWDYLPEEFQLIMRLGVWARTQIEKSTVVGKHVEAEFSKSEDRAAARAKKSLRDAA